MTVIVIRGHTMATDSGMWEGDSLMTDERRKIFRCKWGVMVALNHPGYMNAAIKAMDEAETIPERLELGHDSDIIMLTNEGRVRLYKEDYMLEVSPPFYAVGPASPVAYGALHAGLDAVSACEIAIRVGPWAAGKVQSLSVPGDAPIGDPMAEAILAGELGPAETYDETADTPLWKRSRGL